MVDELSWPPGPPTGRRSRTMAIALGAALLAGLVVVAAAWWLPGSRRHHPSDAAAVPPSSAAGPPGSAVTASPLVKAAGTSVVEVVGSAPSCHRRNEGSGFVYATERVMTTAHVVAGVRGALTIHDRQGHSFKATVVTFDPERDLAILRVPGLSEPALPLRENARIGDIGVIIGYPRKGILREVPARIQKEYIAVGPDLLRRKMSKRQVFALYGGIARGMSGGPLVTTDGAVSAMVFATNLEVSEGSYALTARELSTQAHAGTTALSAVPTGRCAL